MKARLESANKAEAMVEEFCLQVLRIFEESDEE